MEKNRIIITGELAHLLIDFSDYIDEATEAVIFDAILEYIQRKSNQAKSRLEILYNFDSDVQKCLPSIMDNIDIASDKLKQERG